MTASVALVGFRGYGATYLPRLAALEAAGTARLVAVVDTAPPRASDPDAVHAVPWFASLDELLEREVPDVVVVCTPIPTHVPLATQALRAGADVLVEKPTAASLAEHAELVAVARDTGRLCQVGFQTFGSGALAAVREAVAGGEIGELVGAGAVGAWTRTDGYWARSAWAGRRTLDGRDVVDGVVTNPLAHAVATTLHVVGATRTEDVTDVVTDLYHANPIEADDTSSVRVTTATGLPVGFGFTLCAPEQELARVLLRGTDGEITLRYERDEAVVSGPGGERTIRGDRSDLLTDLLGARQDGHRLLCDVSDTGAFMRVLEAVRTAPEPRVVGADHVTWVGAGDERHPVVHDVAAWCERVAREQRTFTELGAPWATRP
ncbi:oxidoreductase [Luteimicrobium album]|uniref:Oxidoreductase n=1 Tax=Luteimicrobium album TaxID=1054550 RepID=A0ABQ6I1R2_9MICO|nr:Gfo/Idh/MocA family oxidoreductase [Luteimicrobium album]GMA24621.1 oxidoreductase [Luteimicrobium album]